MLYPMRCWICWQVIRPAATRWLELGLQSANDKTLQRINRGHGYAAYADAVCPSPSARHQVCAHLIVGLPGEVPMDSLETLHRIVETGVGDQASPTACGGGAPLVWQGVAGGDGWMC